jgi:hypothetical protein
MVSQQNFIVILGYFEVLASHSLTYIQPILFTCCIDQPSDRRDLKIGNLYWSLYSLHVDSVHDSGEFLPVRSLILPSNPTCSLPVWLFNPWQLPPPTRCRWLQANPPEKPYSIALSWQSDAKMTILVCMYDMWSGHHCIWWDHQAPAGSLSTAIYQSLSIP